MNIILRFTVRNLFHQKKWLLLTASGLMVATALFMAVILFSVSYLDAMARKVSSSEGNWTVRLTLPLLSSEAALSRSQVVSHILPVKTKTVSSVAEKNLQLLYWDDRISAAFPPTIFHGRLPEKEGEIALAMNSESSQYYADTEPIVELWSGVQHGSYKVVGLFLPPKGIISPSKENQAIISTKDTQLTPDTKLLFLYSNSPSFQYYEEISNLLQQADIPYERADFHQSLLRYQGVIAPGQKPDLILFLASGICLIVLLTSSFLIYNAFAISLTARKNALSLLAGCGASQKQNRQHIWIESLLLSICSIPLGLLLGILGVKVLIGQFSPLLEGALSLQDLNLRIIIPLWAPLLALTLTLIALGISLIFPARQAGKTAALASLRSQHDHTLQLANIKALNRGWLRRFGGVEAVLAKQNLRRTRQQFRLALSSLIMSLILFFVASSYAHPEIIEAATSYELNYSVAEGLTSLPQEIQQSTIMQTQAQGDKQQFLTVALFIYGFILAVSLISLANIINTSHMSIGQRQREFAILQALGMSKSVLRRMILYESFYYGFKALVISIPSSLLINFALHLISHRQVTFVPNWQSYLLALLLMLATCSFILKSSLKKIAQTSISGLLKQDCR